MIDLEKRHFEILINLLRGVEVSFYVYGSRVKNTNKKFSDLDLCFKDELDKKTVRDLKFALEDSDLPFKVDLSFYDDFSDEFKALIDDDLILFERKNIIGK